MQPVPGKKMGRPIKVCANVEQLEQEEYQEQQEQLLWGLCPFSLARPFSLAHFRNPCCISARGSAM